MAKQKVTKSKAVKKPAKKVLKRPSAPSVKVKRSRKKPKTEEETQQPLMQDYIRVAMSERASGRSAREVALLSANEIPPNKKQNKSVARVSQMGSRTGRTNNDFSAPIVRVQPIGVMDYRQLMLNTRTNQIPDEFGVIRSKTFPMQNIIPTRGGKHSGRTGPIQ